MALKYYSVEPYQELDSGGKFMLGLDDVQIARRAEEGRGVGDGHRRHNTATSALVMARAKRLEEREDLSRSRRSASARAQPFAELRSGR